MKVLHFAGFKHPSIQVKMQKVFCEVLSSKNTVKKTFL